MARQQLQSPGLVLAWSGMATAVLHSGLVVVPLVRLASSPLLGGPGSYTSPNGPTSMIQDAVASAAAVSVSGTWILAGVGLSAAGFAVRNATHRAAAQAMAVSTIPLGIGAIAELIWIQPCSVPGTVIGSGGHVILAVLGAWLALRLGSEAGREAFVRVDSDPG